MKKQIPIFIAGAKSFRDQRVALKAMANDLNTEFSDQKKDVVIYMCSYENFGDHQQEYNQFIADVADLVIFVLDGDIGKHTEDEFRLAVSEYKKEDMPKVLVFLKDFDQHTPGIQKIEHLLEEAFGPEFYYISYSSTEDLCTKAKERIQQHVNRYQHRINTIRRAIAAGVVFLLMIACFITATFFSNRDNFAKDPVLVFAGGGSASGYLKNNPAYNFDVHKYKEGSSLFINMPSRDSYSLLTDWILEHEIKDIKQSKQQCFYPISLSASEASINDFVGDLDTITAFTENGIILSKFIGYDTLTVHFYYPDSTKFPFVNSKTVAIEQLVELIRHDSTLNVYTTRNNSGTYTTYLNHMDSIFEKEDIPKQARNIFYDRHTPFTLERKMTKTTGFIVLCSEYYHPDSIADFEKHNPGTYHILHVTKDNKILKKSIFVYMPALKDKQSDNRYWIPNAAKEFINQKIDTSLHVSQDLQLKNLEQKILRTIETFTE